jgi:large subunit ribosomal protein L6
MSKIGKKAIKITDQVRVELAPTEVKVFGPKGELSTPLLPKITVKLADAEILVARSDDEKQSKANHGLMRSLLANAVMGVTQGYQKVLKLEGTGYRVTAKGSGISMTLGFSHPVEFAAVPGITLKVTGNDLITVEGIDKQLVGQVAANIRGLRPPEPYGGKGIRYQDEVVRRKQGKTAA